MCGNYSILSLFNFSILGSPPRVRELLHVTKNVVDTGRITPACAGITYRMVTFLYMCRDHPRVCGNYYFLYEKIHMRLGSPPRVRELQT